MKPLDRQSLERFLGRTAGGGSAARLRPGQYDAIETVWTARKDTLVLAPTGWGKSLLWMLPAAVLREATDCDEEKYPGLCVVVCPLLALLRDQADRCEDFELAVVQLHSSGASNVAKAIADIEGDDELAPDDHTPRRVQSRCESRVSRAKKKLASLRWAGANKSNTNCFSVRYQPKLLTSCSLPPRSVHARERAPAAIPNYLFPFPRLVCEPCRGEWD